MLVIDMIFMVILFLIMMPLGIWRQAAFAVMKRNFAGYFSNPTGYVFLCIFVLLTSFAAFWPHEFFTTNLANFDQLNKFLPYIMLIFIPAITMSIWAEERRQGTDELLLTLPAKDFDIVIGKFFAAVLVFTVSLLFSQLSNYAVLLAMTGGQLDALLLFSTYLGYWFMGVSMLSIGMVASFLTNNLTVGFIFGAAFNAPLAFFSNADVILPNGKWVQRLYEWSLLQRFEPFGRGLISLPSIVFFVGIAVIGIYLSLILIGRRHWLGGRDGTSMLWHFMARAAFLLAIVVGSVLIVQFSPLNQYRIDISTEKVSTLSETTRAVLDRLETEATENSPPIKINAYVSNNIPTEYVQTRYDLVNLLREFDVLGGNRIQVDLQQGIDPFSEEAILAEKRFGIRPVAVQSESRGALREEQVVMGVAISSGRERVVIPFFPYGMPVEYELMRSINTVSQPTRKKIGIVQTDAFAMGAVMNVQGQNEQVPPLLIVAELQKQYDVERVNAGDPINLWLQDEDGKPTKRRYDMLLVIQPSKMSPTEMTNLIDALQTGQPTAIFEDPFPDGPANFPRYVSGTFFPRTITRGNTNEQADILKLWEALDIDTDYVTRTQGDQSYRFPYLVWQSPSENPYPRDKSLGRTAHMVILEDSPEVDPRFGLHPSTQGINELYFRYAGYIDQMPNSKLNFAPLVVTGMAGRIYLDEFLTAPNEDERRKRLESPNSQYYLAAHITGAEPGGTIPESLEKVSKSKQNTNVIYVADIDILANYFVQMRNEPFQNGINYRYQNMSFVLNTIDSLVGDDTYLDLRNRKIRHVTLQVVEKTTEEAMDELYEVSQELDLDMERESAAVRAAIEEKLRPLQDYLRKADADRLANKPVDNATYQAKLALFQSAIAEQTQYNNRKLEELQNARREKLRRVQLDAELKIQKIQRQFKLAAVIIPPIPPLLVGLIVFTRRRLREREGISKARRLK